MRTFRKRGHIIFGQRPVNAITGGRWIQPPKRPFPLGQELVLNGDFSTDTVWGKGVGWTIAGGVGVGAAGSATKLDQTVNALTTGTTYRVVFDLVTRTAGGVFISVAGVLGAVRTVPGNYVEIIVSLGGITLGITKDAAFAGSVDNMSVRELLNR